MLGYDGAVAQLGAVVGEKEVGLVTALRLMGLRQSAYWTSWVVADLLLGFLTALSIVIWGESTWTMVRLGLSPLFACSLFLDW